MNFKGNAFVGPVLLGVTAGSLVIFMTNGSYLLEMALGISATIIALCSLTLGLSILLALIIFIERGLLFSLSVPFLGGSIKPTDILISAIIIGWIMRYIFQNKRNILRVNVIGILMLAFIGWAVLSALLAINNGENYKDSLMELRRILYYLLFFPISSELNEKNMARIIWIILSASILLSINDIRNYLLAFHDPGISSSDITRVMGMAFVYLVIFFILASGMYIRVDKYKSIFLLSMMLSLVSLSVTYYRSAWFSLLFSILFLLMVSGSQKRMELLRAYRKIAVILALIVFMLLSYSRDSLRLFHSLGSRLVSVYSFRSDVSALHRISEWTEVIEQIKSSPIMGRGLGYKIGFYSPMYSEEKNRMGFFSENYYVHNSYLWVFLKMGLIGAIFYVSIMLLLFRQSMKMIRISNGSEKSGLLVILISCLTAVLLVSFFEQILFLDNYTPFMAFLFAAISSYSRIFSLIKNKSPYHLRTRMYKPEMLLIQTH